jgi:hypothetical protein
MSFLVAAFAFVSLLPPLLMGFFIVSLLWPSERPLLSDLPLKCCLSVGFGFGASSCMVFLWMLIVGQLTRGVFVLEFALLASLSILLVRRRRSSTAIAPEKVENVGAPSSGKPRLLRLVLWVTVASALARYCFLSLQNPHGGFDAYAGWNLRARFLYRGAGYWKNFSAMAWTHPDYPLLVPASIARSWEFIGRETQLIPIVIGLLFTFATIGIVAISISRLRSERQGILAALILLGTPFLIIHGASQYADVPVSFFFVATVALLCFYSESPSQLHFLILAGMAAGFSAWTKNEGILFFTVLFLVHLAVTTAAKGRKAYLREVAALAAGAAPLIVVIGVYKICVAATNDMIGAEASRSAAADLLDMSRYHMVAAHFLKELLAFGEWNPILPVPLLLFFYFLLVNAHVEKKSVPAIGITVLLIVLMLAGFFFVYIVSPFNLEWHLDTSLDRLLLQVWPLAVFAYFAVVQTPERAMREEGVRSRTS